MKSGPNIVHQKYLLSPNSALDAKETVWMVFCHSHLYNPTPHHFQLYKGPV